MGREGRAGADPIRDDRELVRRLLAGEEKAFEQFYSGNFDSLYRFALSRLDRDEDLAQEIVQGALVKAMEKLDTFRGEAALFTWLCTFCRYEISAHFRRLKREMPDSERIDEDRFSRGLADDAPEIRAVLDALAAGRLGPEDELRDKEVARLVHLTLDHLPPRYGEALEWKYFEGLPVVEIADRLELSPKAAESVLTRARGAFRQGFAALTSSLGEGFLGLRPAEAASGGPEDV